VHYVNNYLLHRVMPGTAAMGTNVAIATTDFKGLSEFCVAK
jgi:hypothetical protein